LNNLKMPLIVHTL